MLIYVHINVTLSMYYEILNCTLIIFWNQDGNLHELVPVDIILSYKGLPFAKPCKYLTM